MIQHMDVDSYRPNLPSTKSNIISRHAPYWPWNQPNTSHSTDWLDKDTGSAPNHLSTTDKFKRHTTVCTTVITLTPAIIHNDSVSTHLDSFTQRSNIRDISVPCSDGLNNQRHFDSQFRNTRRCNQIDSTRSFHTCISTHDTYPKHTDTK